MTNIFQSYSRANLNFTHGEGAWLFEKDGRKFLDFGSGIAVNSFGHAHPRLVQALKTQAEKLWHISNLYQIPEQEALATALCDISFASAVFFTNSGAEANECAIKIARRYHYLKDEPRHKILTFEGAFHGRTLATSAATGTQKVLEGFTPKVAGFENIPLNIETLNNHMSEEIAAIMIEPIQGEGGIRIIEDEILYKIRQIANEYGALLIFDEVQTGMGRTGTIFAYEHSGVTPDIMTLAKGIGAGFPLGACLASEKCKNVLTPGTHGSTYGGNPLASVIGLEVINILKEEGVLEHIQQMSQMCDQQFAQLLEEHPNVFEEARGRGLLRGIKIKTDQAIFVSTARENGLLTVPAADNVVRLLPPLNISLDELRQGFNILSETAKSIDNSLQ